MRRSRSAILKSPTSLALVLFLILMHIHCIVHISSRVCAARFCTCALILRQKTKISLRLNDVCASSEFTCPPGRLAIGRYSHYYYIRLIFIPVMRLVGAFLNSQMRACMNKELCAALCNSDDSEVTFQDGERAQPLRTTQTKRRKKEREKS